jgi:hypothetical protein
MNQNGKFETSEHTSKVLSTAINNALGLTLKKASNQIIQYLYKENHVSRNSNIQSAHPNTVDILQRDEDLFSDGIFSNHDTHANNLPVTPVKRSKISGTINAITPHEMLTGQVFSTTTLTSLDFNSE